MAQKESINSLISLQNQKYISIITFSKVGNAVPTPVWFVEKKSKIFVATGGDTYKVKRIRKNSNVQIAPCTRAGKVNVEYFEATGRILRENGNSPILMLFRKKYRLFRLMIYFADLRKKKEAKHVYLEITPN